MNRKRKAAKAIVAEQTGTQVDTRMKALCDNINATGVTICGVQIDTDGAGQSSVPPNCASSANNFFIPTRASQVSSAFQKIGTAISKLGISS